MWVFPMPRSPGAGSLFARSGRARQERQLEILRTYTSWFERSLHRLASVGQHDLRLESDLWREFILPLHSLLDPSRQGSLTQEELERAKQLLESAQSRIASISQDFGQDFREIRVLEKMARKIQKSERTLNR